MDMYIARQPAWQPVETETPMNEDQYSRAKNAISEEMEVEHTGGTDYEVKGKYTVDPVEGTCECPDHEYRNFDCKHLIRVWLEVEWGNVPQPGEEGSDEVTRPMPLNPQYMDVPAELREMDQWVCWEYQRDSNPDHEKDWTKVPLDVSGGFGSSTDPDTWASFDDARNHDAHNTSDTTDGIGIVVSEEDDLIGIDIDDCRDPETGELADGVGDLVEDLGSYTEVSPSGTGLRTFVFGEWPVDSNQTDLIAGEGTELEVYEWGRYLTVTGHHVEGTPMEVIEDTDTIETFAEIMDPGFGLDDE